MLRRVGQRSCQRLCSGESKSLLSLFIWTALSIFSFPRYAPTTSATFRRFQGWGAISALRVVGALLQDETGRGGLTRGNLVSLH